MSEKTDIQRDISGIKMVGFLIANDRDKVKQKMPERLEEFDKIVERKRFTPANLYPIEESLLYQRTACKIIYGDAEPESYYKIGHWDFDQIIETQFGKISISLFAPTLNKALINFPRLFNTVVKGVNVQSVVKGEKEVEIFFGKDPYNPFYWKGFFQGMTDYYMKKNDMKGKGEIKAVALKNSSTKVNVKWE